MTDAPQRVVITAGASGLGRAFAEAFLAEGAQVALCDIDPAALASMRSDFPKLLAMEADVSKEEALDQFMAAAETELGGFDVVFANAGIGGPSGAIEDMDFSAWQRCLAVNLDGAFLTARRAAAVMKRQGSGLLLFTTSTAGMMGYPFRIPYATAKWALVDMTKSLAMELGPSGIRVNALCPGAVEGERMDQVVANEARARQVSEEEVRQRYLANISLRTWISKEEIAAMALYLASPVGSKISGQILTIDGHTEHLAS